MIKIEKVKLSNYRKLKEAELYLDEKMTVIAGSNNAGKTSIVELFWQMFSSSSNSIKVEDMHLGARIKDEEKIREIYSMDCSKEEKIDRYLSLHSKLSKILVDIDIKYDGVDDDLSLFSDYLMDVDDEKTNFYFRYEVGYKPVNKQDLEDNFEDIDKIIQLYNTLTPNYYYCDVNRDINLTIDNKTIFQNLFNYHSVYAVRNLADTSEEKKNLLSKYLLKTVGNDANWKTGIRGLANKVNKSLEEEKLPEKIDDITLKAIVNTLDNFAKTNGGHTGELRVDFQITDDEIENALIDFIKVYYAQDNDLRIQEEKQGLGYSNLIYLLLSIQSFKQTQDPRKVNILFFEEPEAHLHPQMENVFISHLDKTEEDFQKLITTHSSEIAKTVQIEKIRVLRANDALFSTLYDMKKFMEVTLNGNTGLKNFYNKFFQFSMIEVIFADKVILFEGDAERLMLKYMISSSEKFEILASQYISFIQVGGAYAYKYIDLLKFLEVRTLILTDIDYIYDREDVDTEEREILVEIGERQTSNETIIEILQAREIFVIYELQKSKPSRNILYEDIICLKFQGEAEGYARTLEDAILHKVIGGEGKSVFSQITKEEWGEYITQHAFTIPRPKKQKTTIRDRVHGLKGKTDFMYSLLENFEANDIIPPYIEEGLFWLQD